MTYNNSVDKYLKIIAWQTVYCTQQNPAAARMQIEYLKKNIFTFALMTFPAFSCKQIYCWSFRWFSFIGLKLNVVSLPVRVVWYCRHPSGALERI